MQLIPGGGGIIETLGALAFGKKAVGTPSTGQPTETPPPPTREDPEIAEAKKRQRISDLQRRGRSILTSLGEGEPTLNRPRASRLLGE